ncbi:MAG: protein kinase, partial [bacterium]|nr:protein kinase [bacterium]
MSTKPDDFHEQVAQLFEAVVDLSPSERKRYFEERDVDESVCEEVQSLLGSDPLDAFGEGQLGGVAPMLVADPDRTSPAVEWGPGRIVGDYRIEREVARGGMGVVFEATQISLNRRVALKMIHASQLSSEAALSRFRVEAEAVARLDHLGIVPVYEVGSLDGFPYLSMGYISGGSLADLDAPIDERHAAQLVKQIAEAVHYANSRNVVHRDLKPANVLIADDGAPKITDFGLAKRTDEDSDLTVTGTVMGTPGFMAPEQARGENDLVGPLADVYALGGILFYLLLGRAPVRGSNFIDTLQRIESELPAVPHKERAGVSVDLSSICLRCLEKDPAHRYPSAQDVALELRRFLEHEPIFARPISVYGRFRRWCRRSPVVAALSVAAALLTVAVVVVSVVFAVQVSDREARISEQVKTLTQQAKEINAARDEAVASAEESQAILEFFFDDVLGKVTSKANGGLGIDTSVREMMGFAEQRLAERFADRPRAEGWARFRFGIVLREFGEFESSVRNLERGMVLAEEASDPVLPLHIESQLAITFYRSGRMADAERHYRAVLSKLREQRGTLQKAVDPAELSALELGVQKDLGMLLVTTDRPEAALPILREVIASDGPADLRVMAGLNLADALTRTDREADGIKLAENVLQICRREFGEERKETLRAASSLGEKLIHAGRYEDANELLERTHETEVRTSSLEHRSPIMTLSRLVEARAKLGKHEWVVAKLDEMGPVIERVLAEDRHLYWQLQYQLGRSLGRSGRTARAVSALRGALSYWRKQEPIWWLDRDRSLIALIHELGALGKYEEIMTVCRDEIASLQKTPGWQHLARMAEQAAEVLMVPKRYDDALAVIAMARSYEEPVHGMGAGLVRVLLAEAMVYNARGQYGRVLKFIRGQLSEHPRLREEEPVLYCEFRQRFGVGLFRLRRYKQAVEVFREELAIREREQGSANPDVFLARRNLALNLESSGDHDAAVQVLERGVVFATKAAEP